MVSLMFDYLNIRTGGLFQFGYLEVHGAGEMAMGALNCADKGK